MKDENYIRILIDILKHREGDIDLYSKAIREKAEYQNSHPDIRKYHRENQSEAIIRYRGEEIKRYFQGLPEFKGDPDLIPEIPVLPVDWLQENVWPHLIRAGAIPKDQLIPGQKYLGSCRNAYEATWDGEKFTYTRHKFGYTYDEDIPHFQDDSGSDVFIPICAVENQIS